jgi:hypothetical protein
LGYTVSGAILLHLVSERLWSLHLDHWPYERTQELANYGVYSFPASR